MTRIRDLALLVLIALLLSAIVWARPVYGGCRPYPKTPDSPTGIVGCELYGSGIASRWDGPGVARNDCVWPWLACRPLLITSSETGRSIVVVPAMFCDCYVGTKDERIVDLDPATVTALGLEWSRGLYDVVVTAAGQLPDTALRP